LHLLHYEKLYQASAPLFSVHSMLVLSEWKVGQKYISVSSLLRVQEPESPLQEPPLPQKKMLPEVPVLRSLHASDMRRGIIPSTFLPLQSGVGNIANAVLSALGKDPSIPPFEMYTEVIQNSVIKLVNRKYTREWYLERVAAIRRIIPDCGLSTDIFSGFHSETEEDHQMSLSLMRECAYDSAFMFKYSERPGTYASKHLPDDVPEEIKIRRLNEMIELQNQLSAESNAKDVGKTFEVLVEGVSKRSKEQLFGRTEQNKVVVFDRGSHRIGDFVKVKITESSSATLKGTEVTE
jgi:tRNA A37 methylthiotransferase MiaB